MQLNPGKIIILIYYQEKKEHNHFLTSFLLKIYYMCANVAVCDCSVRIVVRDQAFPDDVWE